ncbi:MAG: TrkA C-terminal domain-containing protein [Phycisphaerales bacterium]|nr:TrkA C-terminal domain-containing protein [Phycisphaerales bacterium]
MPIIALFFIAFVSLVIVRIGATALMMTGLSRDVADFQSVSCFFGVGFTTAEAEMIVSHPVRRRIASHLIIAGNIGLTGALGALIVTLVNTDADWLDELLLGSREAPSIMIRVLIATVGITLIFLFFRMGGVRRVVETLIRFSLERSGVVRALDYETLLRAHDGYVVSEFEIEPGHPHVGKTLIQLGLGARGVLVLGIFRDDGEYLGTPHKDSEIMVGDVLTVYGQEDQIRDSLQHA